MRIPAILLAILTAASATFPVRSEPLRLESMAGEYRLTGIVIAVEDGDTLTIRGAAHGKRHRIRLSDIDAPETHHGTKGKPDRPGQPFGLAAAAELRRLALGRPAVAACFETDSYGRHVCLVYVDALQLNAAMLDAGLAWPAERAAWQRDPETPARAAAARAAGLGLWAEAVNIGPPIPPWAWRRQCWQNQVCTNAEW
jgi:endonuclease YncB( thermonuclease family)